MGLDFFFFWDAFHVYKGSMKSFYKKSIEISRVKVYNNQDYCV